MNDNRKIRLIIKMTFKLYKDTHLFGKFLFSKKIGIQLSRRKRNYRPDIRQNFQNLDQQGAEDKVFFQIFKWGYVLVLTDVNFGFYVEP